MKKVIIITCLILSAILILDSFNVWHALAMFYIAGEIPGTRTSLSADVMMQFFALLAGFVIARISNRALLSIFERISLKRTHQPA